MEIAMSNEQLARRAVACDAWEWLRGMLVRTGQERYRLIGYDNGGWQAGVDASPESRPLDFDRLQDCLPDFDDDLTAMGLLVLVRRAWGNPHLSVSYETWSDGESGWSVYCDYDVPGLEYKLVASELEALVAALEGAP